jgi:hypothetical protein
MDETSKQISIQISHVGIKSMQANTLNDKSNKLNLMKNMQILAKDVDNK